MRGEGFLSTRIRVIDVTDKEVTLQSPDLNQGLSMVLRKGDMLDLRLAYSVDTGWPR